MITKRELIVGTYSDLLEYFQAIWQEPGNGDVGNTTLELQLDTIKENKATSRGSFGYICYKTVIDASIHINMVGVQLRD